jgi:hypothetical protein
VTIGFLAGSGASSNANAASIAVTVPVTYPVGSVVVLALAMRTTTVTISSIVDSRGNSWTPIFPPFLNGTNCACALQATVLTVALLAGDTITMNLSAATKAALCVAAYQGGTKANTFSQTFAGANPTVTDTSNAIDEWFVVAFAGQGTGASTAGTGNLRASNQTAGGVAASNIGCALADNTAPASGSNVTSSITNADTIWAILALGLLPIYVRPKIVEVSSQQAINRSASW